MASADSCAFSTAFGGGYSFRSVPHRSPRVPHVSFPPSTCLIYTRWFRVVIGLRLVEQSHPQRIPYMRFLYVRPEVCPRVSMFPESGFLQIPPRDGHPCLWLTVPATESVVDFHHQVVDHAGRTQKSGMLRHAAFSYKKSLSFARCSMVYCKIVMMCKACPLRCAER